MFICDEFNIRLIKIFQKISSQGKKERTGEGRSRGNRDNSFCAAVKLLDKSHKSNGVLGVGGENREIGK